MGDDQRRRRGAILVVDDDVHLRGAMARILEGEGHEVLEAEDGPSAVAMTRAHQPALLLLDYMMPGMNGAQVLAQLREELREAAPPTLLVTASGMHTSAHELGAVAGLEKPFNVPELLDAVALHLADVDRERS